MVFLGIFYLVHGIQIFSDQMIIVHDGKVDGFWTGLREDGYFKYFYEGMSVDRREFLVSAEGGKEEFLEIFVEDLKGDEIVEVSNSFIDLGIFGMGRFQVSYRCEEVLLSGDGEDYVVGLRVEVNDGVRKKSELKIFWRKVCYDGSDFTFSFFLILFLKFAFAFFCILFEFLGFKEKECDLFKSFFEDKTFFYLQFLVFVLLLVIFWFYTPNVKLLTILFNILSAVCLVLILKQRIYNSKIILIVLVLSFGLLLFLFSTIYPYKIIQYIQFACISIFLIQSSKGVPVLALIISSFIILFYTIFNFESNHFPTFESSVLFKEQEFYLPSFLSFSSLMLAKSTFQVNLSLIDVYIPGSFLLKFRRSDDESMNFYLNVVLVFYLFSMIIETSVQNHLNSSSLFISGPLISLALIGSSCCRGEIKKLFRLEKSRLIQHEIQMKDMRIK
jgi:hypothetical protein